jgi:hypothetical protein
MPPHKKPGTLLRSDVELTPEWREVALAIAEQEQAPINPDAEFDKFCNYFTNIKPRPMSNWTMAWRNWCRNALKYQRTTSRPVTQVVMNGSGGHYSLRDKGIV